MSRVLLLLTVVLALDAGVWAGSSANDGASAESGSTSTERGSASQVACAGIDVQLRFANGEDPELICGAVAEALKVLASLGVAQRHTITINIVTLVSVARYLGFGCYDARVDEISLVAGDAFAGSSVGEDFFKVPNSPALYRSLIAHEVAHAVVSQHLDEPLTVAAQEYIAAVVQFSVMDPETRARVLSRFPGEGFDSVSEINGSLYLFAPAWYLVNAYRHFVKQQHPHAFIRRIIAGDIVMRDEFVD